VLPHQVHDAPKAIPLLEMLERQGGHLGSSESAAEKHREDGAIAQAPYG
jgi:hypothetical protein